MDMDEETIKQLEELIVKENLKKEKQKILDAKKYQRIKEKRLEDNKKYYQEVTKPKAIETKKLIQEYKTKKRLEEQEINEKEL